MLEFTKVFPKGHDMKDCWSHKPTIMKCKNIDFGHVDWIDISPKFYDSTSCMVHIIDNIIDVNICDGHHKQAYTFFTKIIRYSNKPHIIHYMFNNGCINKESFTIYFNSRIFDNDDNRHRHFCKCCKYKQFDELTSYLTKVSFNRFKGYYNIEKYYDILKVMLLVIKAQHVIPTTIIKHLIIPFIYQ